VDERTVLLYTADFIFTGATKLATPALNLALQKVGDDAAEQLTACLDAIGPNASPS
jgi:hypothetical protein